MILQQSHESQTLNKPPSIEFQNSEESLIKIN